MPVETLVTVMWLGLALAEPKPPSSLDAELLEFLGNFETKTGQWPELNEALAKKPETKTAAPKQGRATDLEREVKP